MPPIKVVIDSNVLVQAAITNDPIAPSIILLRKALDRRLHAYTSSIQLSEVVDVLTRKKFNDKISTTDAVNYVQLIASRFNQVQGRYVDIDLVPTDAKDNPIVAIALEAGAKYIITEDARNLLSLKVIILSGHAPVQTVSLSEFNRLEP